jgi:benzylsuccinate CoA-transferase BbsF subunit
MGAAMSGATYQFGWPDRPPSGPWGPWTDAVTPRFIVASILAALHNRSRTGKGSYIDLAQAECGIQFMMPAYYEFAANGRVPERRGAAGSPLAAPQGVYPCTGKDRWVAIDASSQDRWTGLRNLVGGALTDSRFNTIIGRLRNRDDLDRAIANWTRTRESDAVEAELQAARIPAHVVSRALDLARDPDLRHVDHLVKINDPVVGECEIEGPRASFDRTPTPPTRRGPRIGEHTNEILRDVCRLSEQEIERLSVEGILQ